MKEKKNIGALISEYFIFVIFIALVIVLTCLKPSFITPGNLVNILKQASINGILAFGMMFVIALVVCPYRTQTLPVFFRMHQNRIVFGFMKIKYRTG